MLKLAIAQKIFFFCKKKYENFSMGVAFNNHLKLRNYETGYTYISAQRFCSLEKVNSLFQARLLCVC